MKRILPLHCGYKLLVQQILVFICMLFLNSSKAFAELPSYYQKLVTLTAERSPEIKIKKKALEQKSYNRWSTGTLWLPRLDWQISSNRSNSNLYTGQLGTETEYKQSGLALSFPIYRRSVHLNLMQSKADFALEVENYQGALSELDWKLRQRVGTLLISEYKLAATKKSLEAAQKTSKETNIRYTSGSRSQLDVLKSQAQLTLLESQILGGTNEILKNKDALLEMTGLNLIELHDLGFPIDSSDELFLEKAIDSITLSSGKNIETAEVLEQFERQGPLKKNAILNLELARVRAVLISAKEWPDLAFKATYQKLSQDWDQLGQATESHSFGITLTIPLFSFGSGYTTYREAKALEIMAQNQSEQTLKEARHKLVQLAEQIKVLVRLVQAQEMRRGQSLELERLTGKSYDYGKSTIQDLLATQNETLNAKLELARTRLDLVIAEKQLDWNLGRLAE